jgi:hypothetical protein
VHGPAQLCILAILVEPEERGYSGLFTRVSSWKGDSANIAFTESYEVRYTLETPTQHQIPSMVEK